MIRELLAELDAGATPLDLDALARRLGTSPAAVEGALELLVRKGRVVRDAAAAGACDGCSARSLCNPLMWRGTRFIPVPAGAVVAIRCGVDRAPGAAWASVAGEGGEPGLRRRLPIAEQGGRRDTGADDQARASTPGESA